MKKETKTTETETNVTVQLEEEICQEKSVWIDSWIYLGTSRMVIAGALWDFKKTDIVCESFVRERIEWFLTHPAVIETK